MRRAAERACGGAVIGVEIFLVRHASHADVGLRLTGRAPGGALTARGAREAEAVAERLGAQGLHEVLTSPRERARATAEAIAARAGAPLAVEGALDEIDFGLWTGAAFEALEGQPPWVEWNRARATARAPGGESMAEVADRAGALVDALARGRDGLRVALVTHCDVIRALVARVLGLSLDNLLRLEVSPASVSRVQAGPWGARLLSLNEGSA